MEKADRLFSAGTIVDFSKKDNTRASRIANPLGEVGRVPDIGYSSSPDAASPPASRTAATTRSGVSTSGSNSGSSGASGL